MPDQTIAISPGAGVNVDVSEVTQSDGTVAERQRVVLGDDIGNLASLSSSGEISSADDEMRGTLAAVLSELRQIKYVLAAWTGIEPVDLEG